MSATSDIDVAVICSPKSAAETEAAMERVAEAVRGRFGNRLNVTIGTSSLKQLRRPGRKGSRLWNQIADESIPLLDQGVQT
ncbi:MAG: hypothetical protein WDA71_04570 [Actinomycetota bacterium]